MPEPVEVAEGEGEPEVVLERDAVEEGEPEDDDEREVGAALEELLLLPMELALLEGAAEPELEEAPPFRLQ